MSLKLKELAKDIRIMKSNKDIAISKIPYPEELADGLEELADFIGNERVKITAYKQVKSIITSEKRKAAGSKIKSETFMINALLTGPPGVGKTSICHILGKIWVSMGYLKTFDEDEEILMVDKCKSVNTTAIKLISYVLFYIIVFTILTAAYKKLSNSGYSMLLCILIISFFAILIMLALLKIPSITVDVDSYINNYSCKTGKVLKPKCPKEKIFSKDLVVNATRRDLCAKYQGHTDKQTFEFLENNKGKVIFFDEAYTILQNDKDMYGKEALDEINRYLSENPRNIIAVFAGYDEDTLECIFDAQPGLKRRFMWRFECKGYTTEELFEVFKIQAMKDGWSLNKEDEMKTMFIRAGIESFPQFGGDTHKLLYMSKDSYEEEWDKNTINLKIDMLEPRHIQDGLVQLSQNQINTTGNRKLKIPNFYDRFLSVPK